MLFAPGPLGAAEAEARVPLQSAPGRPRTRGAWSFPKGALGVQRSAGRGRLREACRLVGLRSLGELHPGEVRTWLKLSAEWSGSRLLLSTLSS